MLSDVLSENKYISAFLVLKRSPYPTLAEMTQTTVEGRESSSGIDPSLSTLSTLDGVGIGGKEMEQRGKDSWNNMKGKCRM